MYDHASRPGKPSSKEEDAPSPDKPPEPPITRIPSVLPDAETSPAATSANNTTPASGYAVGGGEDGGDNGGANLRRASTVPSPHFALPLWRKSVIIMITSFTALSVAFASTSLFPLTSEIAGDLGTTPVVVQVTNALVLFTMGCSGFVWAPVGRLAGRKQAWIGASVVFLLCTAGTALAPRAAEEKTRLKIFVAMRILSGFEGTFFHVTGQTWLADIFEPTQRGTATGFFLLGTVFGPAFGPCISGIMVTYAAWTSILWLQCAMIGVGLVSSIFFLPEIRRPGDTERRKAATSSVLGILKEFNPSPVFKVMLLPNVILTDLTCGLLSWSQYTLLAAPRHLLNPRFHLTTPLVSGLFYIAPGIGFLLGTVVGGKFSDMTVIKWIRIRGFRLPQDRLNSGMVSFFFVIPASCLIYGWGLQYEVGGLALPIVTAFFYAGGLLMAFASVNTYCAEVLPKSRTEVIASKYFWQYTFSTAGSGTIVPMIDAIGIGPASTIGVAFVLLGGVLTFITAKFGLQMQHWAQRKGVGSP